MDATDELILDLLRVDGRASYGRIGGEVGLSASAVKRRVDRLVATGVIESFSVRTGAAHRPDRIEAYVEIYCSGTVSPQVLRELLEQVPEVQNASTISGQADAIVHMVAPTIARLEAAIERIREAPNVDHTVSAIVLTPVLRRD
ncbi:Lrp/AsnC family transcriptional regulator [Microbacterium fluvii]|uniref:Lrp/AsnC family transcriptional regulator n=1 Tax=Microbacterium fluvii TaxID=415215 RepID=A0ABW2HEK9_9MICO|nr:Lrp/AsnC family transcriptional regulator [Microbacterium fluvii]MCU4673349.1 Lrp/AsnC family transcriptional regulator [Microbacterium fluvii]